MLNGFKKRVSLDRTAQRPLPVDSATSFDRGQRNRCWVRVVDALGLGMPAVDAVSTRRGSRAHEQVVTQLAHDELQQARERQLAAEACKRAGTTDAKQRTTVARGQTAKRACGGDTHGGWLAPAP